MPVLIFPDWADQVDDKEIVRVQKKANTIKTDLVLFGMSDGEY
jgi:hypothetical protein